MSSIRVLAKQHSEGSLPSSQAELGCSLLLYLHMVRDNSGASDRDNLIQEDSALMT